MATIINADTSDGLKLTSDTSGQLELQSAGSTKVTMDTSGNVGIGKDTLLSFYPADQSYANIKFEWDTGDAGYLHSTAYNGMKWTANGSERMRITSDGRGLSQFTAKAWVNFNGTGTVAIGDSHNVSSINDIGVGWYGITYTNALGNDDHSLSGMLGGASGIIDIQAMNTTSPQIITRSLAGAQQDQALVCVTAFGD